MSAGSRRDIDERVRGNASPTQPSKRDSAVESGLGSSTSRGPSATQGGSQAPGLPTPTLPKGGGAIRGIGEKFSMAAATGTCSMSVPIAVSPGRGGAQPSLSVNYSSGGGNGPFGLGWSLDVPSISRKTDKKLPEYDDERDSDVFLLSGAEDLVRELEETSPGTWTPRVFDRGGFRIERFRPRTEGLFARIERRTHLTSGNVFWVTTDRNNVTSIFGESEAARIADPVDATRIFSWLLEATYDDRGNVVLYTYREEDLTGVSDGIHEDPRRVGSGVDAQKYPKRVRYGNSIAVRGADLSVSALDPMGQTFHFTVVFDYGDHDAAVPAAEPSQSWACRPDPFSSYKPGFEVRTYRLCKRVLVFHYFPGDAVFGSIPRLVRSTTFEYESGPTLTYLKSVTHKGHAWNGSAYDTSAMAPVSFGYQLPVLSADVHELDDAARDSLPPVIDGRAHRWVDLDGEGIPGLLSEHWGAWSYRRNLGEGLLAAPRVLPARPSTASLTGTGARQELLSLEGNGQLALVEFADPAPGYFEREPDDNWSDFVPFKAIPVINWSDPNLQFIDLNGDGFGDILVTEGLSLLWYPSRGKDGFDAPIRVPLPRDDADGPAVVFADGEQSIHLADMSGDGLVDLARIRNGEIAYWPNLGHGRFGAKVTMSSSPWFDNPDIFDPARIRLFDVDGSGTTDILYLGSEGVRLWWNQAGNSWSAAQLVTDALTTHPQASISVVDLLGTGTGCLTWFTTLESEGAPRLRYIDLLEGKKPHLLVQQTNGMGLERRVEYAASTKFYLDDLRAGVTWATRLPFPVQCVSRVEVIDHLAGTRLVSSYRYRHGFYDGYEREFRGFGMVEQLDAESYTAGAGEHELPPVRTRTWFHTGAWREGDSLEEAYKAEYYTADSEAVLFPDSAYVGVALADAQEWREAARALKGLVLRQEVYADDGTVLAPHPYTVTERRSEVRRLQPRKASVPYSVFFAHPREELTYHYERAADDPRVLHALTLEVDDFGNVLRSAAVAYPRRTGSGTPQQQLLVSAQETVVTNVADQVWYRAGVPLASTNYELHGLSAPGAGGVFDFATVKTALDSATEISFEATPSAGKKRVLSRQRTIYWKDDLSDPIAFGDPIQSLALVHHVEQLAMTGGLVTGVYGTDVDSTMLEDAGYLQDGSGDWRAPSGMLEYDAGAFFLPIAMTDPFGNRSSVEYDDYALLPVETHSSTTTPALDNVVSFENDYRVLQPKKLTDPNDNVTELAFDALGMVIKTALEGKGEGDDLGDPTTTFEYDLFAYVNDGKPVVAHMTAKEIHGASSPLQHAYAYTDGSGRELLTKVTAPPDGVTPRFIGNGRTVFDNKGNPIKKYEPYFSTTSEFEPEAGFSGVSPILRYDPLGRLIRTDFPDGTYSKVVFDAWKEEAWDQNDTVADSAWYATNHALSSGTPMRRAADLAYAHRGTPAISHYDTLGRAFKVEQDVGTSSAHVFHATTTALDIVGNPRSVTDARSNVTLAQTYDLLKRAMRTISAEAGESRVLPDVAGVPVHTWNSRSYHMRTVFDELRRPRKVYAKHASDTETLVLLTFYGEALGASPSKTANVRGQSYRRYDSAGVETDETRDFKGNLLTQKRVLTTGYTTTPDWVALESDTTLSAAESHAASQFASTPEVFTTLHTYDALNRVTSTTTPDGSVTTPTYDEAQRLKTVAANVRGASTATDFVTAVTYNARGQREAVTYANGTVTEYTYDPNNFRLTTLVTTRTSDSAVLQDLRYYYDAVGNVVETRDYATQSLFFTDSSSPPLVSGDSQYEYDPLYRLSAAEGREHPGYFLSQADENDIGASTIPHPNDTTALVRYREEYEYDGVGNILSVTHKDGATTKWTRWYQYLTTKNRLAGTSDSGDTEHDPYVSSTTDYTDHYAHDARGNMTSMPHLAAMDWDFADRFQHAQMGTGGGATHAYFVHDGAGNRVRKVWEKASGLVEERIYVGGYELWRKRLSGALDEERQTLHVMDDRKRIAMVETKTVASGSAVSSPSSYQRYQLDDLLGSSRVEVDASAALLTYEEYHPYGTTAFRASSGSSNFASKRYRYTGKERDDETGLYYYGARYYPPWLGRWTAADPAGMVDGPNVYAYVKGNPIGLSDPDGTEAEPPLVSRLRELHSQNAAGASTTVSKDVVGALERALQTPTLPKTTPAPATGVVEKQYAKNKVEIADDEALGIGPEAKGYGTLKSIQAKIDAAYGTKDADTRLLWMRRAAREAVWAADSSIDLATVNAGIIPSVDHDDDAVTNWHEPDDVPHGGPRYEIVFSIESAFVSAGWLLSTAVHEPVHVHQYLEGRTGARSRPINEVEAYDAEVMAAGDTGISEKQLDDIRGRLAYWLGKASDTEKANRKLGIYDPAPDKPKSAPAPKPWTKKKW